MLTGRKKVRSIFKILTGKPIRVAKRFLGRPKPGGRTILE